jgi:hypothetical protein
MFSAVASILVFATSSNNIHVYAQQSYSPSTSTASTSPIPLSQFLKQTNSTGSGSNVTMTTNMPIVVRPLPGGTCPTGYHLVSGAVCIKDITPSPTKTTSTASIPTPAIPTTNTTESFSIPSPSTSQVNGTNPTNNEEHFNTKILKSFNNQFK